MKIEIIHNLHLCILQKILSKVTHVAFKLDFFSMYAFPQTHDLDTASAML